MVKISFSNRAAYTFIILGIIAIVAFGVNAYNPSGTGGTPSTMGHSVDEVAFSQGNLVLDAAGVHVISNTGGTSGLGFYLGGALLANCNNLTGYALGTSSTGKVNCYKVAGGTSQWQDGSGGIYYTTGNVGIGTSNLINQKLGVEISSNIFPAIRGSNIAVSTTAYAIAGQSDYGVGIYDFSDSGKGVYGQSTSGLAGDFRGTLNAQDNLIVGGNLGVGTSAPSSKLSVAGNISVSGVIKNSAGDVVIQLG